MHLGRNTESAKAHSMSLVEEIHRLRNPTADFAAAVQAILQTALTDQVSGWRCEIGSRYGYIEKKTSSLTHKITSVENK